MYIDLSEFDKAFVEAKMEKREFGPVPDGDFKIKIEKVEIALSKSSSKPMIKWTLVILGPTFVGRKLFRNSILSSEMGIKILKRDLITCGLNLSKASEIPSRLVDLLDLCLDVTKVTKNDFENIYFKRLTSHEEDMQDQILKALSDDIPF